MVNTFQEIDYIEQLERENKLLKHRVMQIMQSSNRLIMSEKIKNDNLTRENITLKRKVNYLTLLIG